VILGVTLLGSGVASAGPRSPANYGVQNPQQLPNCWHPDPVKCFSTGWSSGEEVHVVADPFEGEDGIGVVTFWCQSNIGFKYQIWVADLEPGSHYTVTTVGTFSTTLGTFRTDPAGYGGLNGVRKLAPGGYYLVLQIRDSSGAIVLDTTADGQGFGVFPH
jgi:hypothetical protein